VHADRRRLETSNAVSHQAQRTDDALEANDRTWSNGSDVYSLIELVIQFR